MPLQTEKILATFVHDVCIDKTSATIQRVDVLDDILTGLVPERIFKNTTTGVQVDGETLSTFYIEDTPAGPVKHMEQLDAGWQSLACAWNDELYNNAGTWIIKTDQNRLVEQSLIVRNQIKEAADNYYNSVSDRFTREIEILRVLGFDMINNTQQDSALMIDVLLNPTGNKATYDVGDLFAQCRVWARKIYLGLDTITNLKIEKAAENTFGWVRLVKFFIRGWWANVLEGQRQTYLNYENNATVWTPSTVYAVGSSVYDPVTNKFYFDEVGHTSSAVDFATDASVWTEVDPTNIVWEPYPNSQLNS